LKLYAKGSWFADMSHHLVLSVFGKPKTGWRISSATKKGDVDRTQEKEKVIDWRTLGYAQSPPLPGEKRRRLEFWLGCSKVFPERGKANPERMRIFLERVRHEDLLDRDETIDDQEKCRALLRVLFCSMFEL
jgi:hypothetical protein